MIIETESNLFETSKRTLLVPCNGAGVMGAGLAKVFRLRVPFVYHEYKLRFPRVDNPHQLDRTRSYVLVNIKHPRKNSLIFCTKYHWKEDASTFLIERNLATLNEQWDDLEIESLAMPPIGCGYGNLDYRRDVRGLIYKHLATRDVEVCGLSSDILR